MRSHTFKWPFLMLVFILFLVASCAEPAALDPVVDGEPAGFWKGLVHGFILLFTFIISLFRDDVAVYAAFNSGGWYDFGFLLGVLIFFGGGGKGSSR